MGRRKKTDVTVLTAPPLGNPIPRTPEIKGDAREELAMWMKQRVREIDAENKERIKLLREVGEHPSPVFAKIVQQHGALGMPKSLVGKMLGISVATLNQYYAEDYDLGEISAIRSVAANAMRIGTSTTDPNAARVAMQILDRRGGEAWRPPAQKVEMDDNRDKPPLIDASKLNYEERQALRAMLERVAAGGESDAQESSGDDELTAMQPGMDII